MDIQDDVLVYLIYIVVYVIPGGLLKLPRRFSELEGLAVCTECKTWRRQAPAIPLETIRPIRTRPDFWL